MKKKLLIGAVAALFLGTGVFTATSLTQKEQISDLTLANIEAMTFNPDDDINASGLGGPQVAYDCPGWGTGDGYRCAAENSFGCSQIPCR